MQLLDVSPQTWIPFIHQHWDENPDDLLLKYHHKNKNTPADLPIQELIQQLISYKKAAVKFPRLHRDGMLYTPKSIEQSTGEAMVRYKSGKWSGSIAVDGTGGLGMDTVALAQTFERVIHIEPDVQLQKIARHNHQIMGIGKVVEYMNTTIEEWLSNNPIHADAIYLDPSRRDSTRRFFSLEDSQPNVVELKHQLLNNCNLLACKLSPMFDADALLQQLPETGNIECCSFDFEVKEVLAEIEPSASSSKIRAVLVDENGQIKHSINRENATESLTSIPDPEYLYQPDPAVIKAGATVTLASQLNLEIIGNPGFYLTSDKLNEHFPGKIYRIEQTGKYQPKRLKKLLAELRYTHIRIHRKNFPVSPDELYKKLRVSMGNQADLFLTRDENHKPVFFLCQPV